MKAETARIPLPDARTLALQIGAGRALIAAAILAAPVPAARLFGTDTATAQRVTWLTRMMGVRDGVLGVGTLGSSRPGRDARGWLIAGAVADAVDALVLAGALRHGRIRGTIPAGIVAGAASAAALGAVTAAVMSAAQQLDDRGIGCSITRSTARESCAWRSARIASGHPRGFRAR